VASGPPVVYEADYPEYGSLAGAAGAAGDVVPGEIVGKRTELIYPDAPSGDPNLLTNPQAGVSANEIAQIPPVVTTVFDVRVTSVLEGDVVVGDTIQVSQLGGAYDGATYVEKDTPALEQGNSYLLLLADHGPGSPYDLVNPSQAIYVEEVAGQYSALNGNGFAGVSRSSIEKAAASGR